MMRGPLLALCAAGAALSARTIEVGPSRAVRTIREAAAQARPGDLVLIDSGVYHEAVFWRGGSVTGPPITVRGAGKTRPVIDGAGIRMSGRRPETRALFEVEGHNYVFENLEFRNARNGQNACGFRLLFCRKTVVRNCRVTWCDMGFQSTGNDELLVENSEIAFNGSPQYNGYSHNFYIAGDRTTVRYCYIHDSTNGQTFKTRGRYTELLYNYIADAHDRIEHGDTTKELGFQQGQLTSRPNAHAVLIGNIIVKRGSGNAFIDFGPEGAEPGRNGTLFMVNNTVIRESPRDGWMLRLGHATGRAVLYNNIFTGFRFFARGPGAANITGARNWFPAGAEVPPGLKETIQGKAPMFVDEAGRDYRPMPGSPLIDGGVAAPGILDEAGRPAAAEALLQYAAHLRGEPRPRAGRAVDIGALEFDPSRLDPAAPAFEGRILTVNGRPVARLPVVIEGPANMSTLTGQDGRFTARMLPPGEYRVIPWPFHFPIEPAVLALRLPAAGAAGFSAPATHSIHGKATGAYGQPLPNVAVYIAGPRSAWTLTNLLGEFEIDGLPGGAPYVLRAARSSAVFGEQPLTVGPLKGRTWVELRGEGRFLVAGSVRDASGQPLADVRFDVTGDASASVKSNVRGNWAASNLREGGTYTITPSHPSYRFDPPSITLRKLDRNERGRRFTALPR